MKVQLYTGLTTNRETIEGTLAIYDGRPRIVPINRRTDITFRDGKGEGISLDAYLVRDGSVKPSKTIIL